MQHNEMLSAAVGGTANPTLPAPVQMAEVLPMLYKAEPGD